MRSHIDLKRLFIVTAGDFNKSQAACRQPMNPSTAENNSRGLGVIPGGVNSPARAFGGVAASRLSSIAAKGRSSTTSTAIATSITSARGDR